MLTFRLSERETPVPVLAEWILNAGERAEGETDTDWASRLFGVPVTSVRTQVNPDTFELECAFVAGQLELIFTLRLVKTQAG